MEGNRFARIAEPLLSTLLVSSSLYFTLLISIFAPQRLGLGIEAGLAAAVAGCVAVVFLFGRFGPIALASGALLAALFMAATAASPYFASAVLHAFLFSLPFGWLAIAERKTFPASIARLRAEGRQIVPDLLIGVAAAALVLAPLLFAQSFALDRFGYGDTAKVSEKVLALPLWLIIFSFTFVPFSEEFFFRSFLLQKLSRFGPAIGVLASSLIFMLAHYSYGSIGEFAGALTIGVLISLLFLWRKSVYPGIAAHATINLISVIIIALSTYLPAGVILW